MTRFPSDGAPPEASFGLVDGGGFYEARSIKRKRPTGAEQSEQRLINGLVGMLKTNGDLDRDGETGGAR
jgi:hypothetical protein